MKQPKCTRDRAESFSFYDSRCFLKLKGAYPQLSQRGGGGTFEMLFNAEYLVFIALALVRLIHYFIILSAILTVKTMILNLQKLIEEGIKFLKNTPFGKNLSKFMNDLNDDAQPEQDTKPSFLKKLGGLVKSLFAPKPTAEANNNTQNQEDEELILDPKLVERAKALGNHASGLVGVLGGVCMLKSLYEVTFGNGLNKSIFFGPLLLTVAAALNSKPASTTTDAAVSKTTTNRPNIS